MKLLKLIPAAAIVLTAFTTFEANAGYPTGYTKKNSCDNNSYYKLQKTDTPASYGLYDGINNKWIKENVSYNCATSYYKYYCEKTLNQPGC